MQGIGETTSHGENSDEPTSIEEDSDEPIEENPDEPIDLSKLPALRRFAIVSNLKVVDDAEMIRTPFFWLSKLLRSGYPTPVSQQLEVISMLVCYDFHDFSVVRDILHWKDILDTLLEGEFNNLQRLNIFVIAQSEGDANRVVNMLNESVHVKGLRARRNLVVCVAGKCGILFIHPCSAL